MFISTIARSFPASVFALTTVTSGSVLGLTRPANASEPSRPLQLQVEAPGGFPAFVQHSTEPLIVADPINVIDHTNQEASQAAVFATKASKSTQVPMKLEKIYALIERARQARAQGDAEAFANLFALDGQLVLPGLAWSGRAAIRHAALAEMSPARIEIRQVLVQGNRAVVEWKCSMVDPDSQIPQDMEEAIAIEFRNGYIIRWREYSDRPTQQAKSPDGQLSNATR
jgi:uncharacterized protein (TIGR02246 family)